MNNILYTWTASHLKNEQDYKILIKTLNYLKYIEPESKIQIKPFVSLSSSFVMDNDKIKTLQNLAVCYFHTDKLSQFDHLEYINSKWEIKDAKIMFIDDDDLLLEIPKYIFNYDVTIGTQYIPNMLDKSYDDKIHNITDEKDFPEIKKIIDSLSPESLIPDTNIMIKNKLSIFTDFSGFTSSYEIINEYFKKRVKKNGLFKNILTRLEDCDFMRHLREQKNININRDPFIFHGIYEVSDYIVTIETINNQFELNFL